MGAVPIYFHAGIFGFSGTLLDTPELFAPLFVAATWFFPVFPQGGWSSSPNAGGKGNRRNCEVLCQEPPLWVKVFSSEESPEVWWRFRRCWFCSCWKRTCNSEVLKPLVWMCWCWNRRYNQSMKSSSLFNFIASSGCDWRGALSAILSFPSRTPNTAQEVVKCRCQRSWRKLSRG